MLSVVGLLWKVVGEGLKWWIDGNKWWSWEQRQNVPRERGRAQILPARLSFELQNISGGMAGISGGRRGLQVVEG